MIFLTLFYVVRPILRISLNHRAPDRLGEWPAKSREVKDSSTLEESFKVLNQHSGTIWDLNLIGVLDTRNNINLN